MPTNTSSAQRESKRLARPGTALDSCKNVAAPNFLPTQTGAAEVKPPMANTASGRSSAIAARTCRIAVRNPNRKRHGRRHSKATAGVLTCAKSGTVATAF